MSYENGDVVNYYMDDADCKGYGSNGTDDIVTKDSANCNGIELNAKLLKPIRV